jgi:amidase
MGMSMAATGLWRMSAMDLAEAIRSGQASSQEVIEAHLRRIEAVNPSVNAVTVVLSEQAPEAAKAADQATADGGELGPLHGVPFTVKENIDLAGTPTTQGIKALIGAVPGRDAPHVARLRAAGAIPIGHTNCPDLGIRWHAESELWGATINPWDRSRTPGGSSGGEAAALAAGMTPLGVGGDLGGSLRWPAQCCGIYSLKPTLGRVPRGTTIEPADLPDRQPADAGRGAIGTAGCRPAGRVRGDRRAQLARSVDGAGAAARPRTRKARPWVAGALAAGATALAAARRRGYG